MPDHKELYLKLFRATEETVGVLIAAQRECEELCIGAPEPEIKIVSIKGKVPRRPETDGTDGSGKR